MISTIRLRYLEQSTTNARPTGQRGFYCYTYQGANVLEPGHIHHAGSGATVIGEMDSTSSPRLQRLIDILNAAGLPATASTNVLGVVWGKLLANIAIKVGRKLKWDPAKELFIGDAAANAMLDRKRRDPWQLPKV